MESTSQDNSIKLTLKIEQFRIQIRKSEIDDIMQHNRLRMLNMKNQKKLENNQMNTQTFSAPVEKSVKTKEQCQQYIFQIVEKRKKRIAELLDNVINNDFSNNIPELINDLEKIKNLISSHNSQKNPLLYVFQCGIIPYLLKYVSNQYNHEPKLQHYAL